MSEFLDNLNKALEKGEFNSDAAKKIIELNELADIKAKSGNTQDDFEKRMSAAGVKTVSEEEATMVNSEYEKVMFEIKQKDLVNSQLATLIEIEDMVKLTIGDMLDYVNDLETKFGEEFEKENPIFGELSLKIEQIKSKYSTNN